MALRRWDVTRKRAACKDEWPIKPGSERPPAGWPGWPDGKQFALVLTHDVEGPEGIAKIRPLIELERSLGFRSSFNLIPEGSYKVSAELRNEILAAGCEIGVHDLYHNGKLFHTHRQFKGYAVRIHQHAVNWNVCGFRAGFMLNNLQWLHDLEVEYDASTFDTDPFEPQPIGQNTIFPFWVPNPSFDPDRRGDEADPFSHTPSGSGDRSRRGNEADPLSHAPSGSGDRSRRGNEADPLSHAPWGRGQGAEAPSAPANPGSTVSPSDLQSAISDLPSQTPDHRRTGAPAHGRTGYVELPYTLPQDSTLFLLLREPNPDIWLRKLDWVAEHGGMALVNVHPDYLRFKGEPGSSRTYPMDHYVRLLEHVRNRYADRIWQPLPREVARFVRSMDPLPVLRKPRSVCMVTHSYYETDMRVTRYAETLAERGDHVQVLALQRSPEVPKAETVRGVHVVRLRRRFGKQEKHRWSYLDPLVRFLFLTSVWIAREYRRQRYDILHIHNVPDFLVFAALYPRLRGAKVILDIHDIVPEFYATKFQKPQRSWTLAMIRWMERASAKVADHVIIANHLWLEKYSARTGTRGRCSVLVNNVDLDVFRPLAHPRDNGRKIVLFPGGLQWHQGVDIAIQAFNKVLEHHPDAEFHIYGEGNMKLSLVAQAEQLGLNGKVKFFTPLPLRQIAEVMAAADLGVVPKRADSFGNEAYSTKILEFMAAGVPVIASSTKIDRYYFNDSVVRFFESGNSGALAQAMIEILGNDVLRAEMAARGAAYAARHSWQTLKSDYLKLVDDLCACASKG